MTGLIIFLILLLLAVVVVQIGRVTELSAKIRGEEEVEQQKNNRTAFWLVVFMVAFLIACVVSAYYYKDMMLGYGPLLSASEHGAEVDSLFNVTLLFTGVVFVITHILLFWYGYKYRRQKGRKAKFLADNHTLELFWTLVPAIVMTFLVVKGLIVWNDVMPDVNPEDQYIEIEATGYQFAWDIRYPGPDNKLGTKDYRLIKPGVNGLGLDWNDTKSLDDVILGGGDKIVLPVDTTIRVRITAKDVLHNFYLPHFRVKMDAVPGLPSYFIFRPTKTTAEFREELRKYPEWNTPYDPEDPESKARWEEFNFELACAELCGIGHYSMRRVVEIVTKEEYEAWKSGLTSFYSTSIRNTENDPYVGALLDYEIAARSQELSDDIVLARSAEDEAGKIVNLKHVFFETGSATLSPLSKYELDHLTSIMSEYSDMRVELRGHTDNTGDADANMSLSQNRALSVLNYLKDKGVDEGRLSSKGFGQSLPSDTNDTTEGRQNNRRTELRIISK